MEQKLHSQFESEVARILTETGVRFLPRPTVGGIQPDFLVESADGRRLVLEIKGWDPDRKSVDRAIKQARLYQKATGADDAFIVLPRIENGDARQGVLALHEVAHWAAGDWSVRSRPGSKVGAKSRRSSKTRTSRAKVEPTTERFVFAAMPFAKEYDDVFFVSMTHAADSIKATCRRVDKEEFEGDIVAEIKRLIHESVAVIADLSEARPNVLYEIGYAHALGRPTVPICSGSFADLPFDVRNWNVLSYLRGQTHELRDRLARRLKAAVSRMLN